MDDAGRRDEAEPLLRQALEALVRVLGADHPDTISAVSSLGRCIQKQGRCEEAEPMYRQAWQDRVRVLGADHKHTINALSDLALSIDVSGQSAKAKLSLYTGKLWPPACA